MFGRHSAALLALLALVPVGAPHSQADDVTLRAAVETETIKGDLKAAIPQFQQLATSSDRAVAAQALLHLGACYEMLGRSDARATYEQVITKYADQPEAVATANGRLAALGAQADTSRVRLWTLPPLRRLVSDGVSPNGRYVLFTVLRDGNQSAGSQTGSLWVHDLNAGKDWNVVPATAAPRPAPAFVFSPDSRQIAYGADTTDGFELRLAKVDGSGGRVLWREPGAHLPGGGERAPWVYLLTWLGDGRHIALHVSGLPNQVGSDVTVSVPDGSAEVKPADDLSRLSPDGKYRLRVVPETVQAGQVIEVGPIGGSMTPVFPGSQGIVFSATHWSADGRYIFFWCKSPTGFGWWIQRLAAGKPDGAPEPLKGSLGGGMGGSGGLLGNSADGSLFYTETTQSRSLYAVDLDSTTGRVTSAASPISLSFAGDTGGSAPLSPDGEFVAYTGIESNTSPYVGTSSLVVKSLRTGQERTVSLAPIKARNVWAWFPDSRTVIVDDQLGGGKMAWRRVDIDTGKSSTVFDGQTIEHPAAAVDLTRDGKVLLLSSDLPNHRTLIRRDLDTGDMKVLFEMPGEDTLWPAKMVSPDGQQVAFESHDKATDTYIVRSIPTNGGPVRELFRSKQETNLLGWLRDGQHLLLAQTNPASSLQDLLSLPVAGGPAVPSGLSMSRFGWASTTPDGHRLMIPAETGRTELWVARKLLADAQK